MNKNKEWTKSWANYIKKSVKNNKALSVFVFIISSICVVIVGRSIPEISTSNLIGGKVIPTHHEVKINEERKPFIAEIEPQQEEGYYIWLVKSDWNFSDVKINISNPDARIVKTVMSFGSDDLCDSPSAFEIIGGPGSNNLKMPKCETTRGGLYLFLIKRKINEGVDNIEQADSEIEDVFKKSEKRPFLVEKSRIPIKELIIISPGFYKGGNGSFVFMGLMCGFMWGVFIRESFFFKKLK